MVPANTFDNVKGQFPIGFFLWHTDCHEMFVEKEIDIYEADGTFAGTKLISSYSHDTNVIEWLRKFYDKGGDRIGFLRMNGTNVQNNLGIYLTSVLSENDLHNHFYAELTKKNVIPMCIYLSIRQAIEANWKNDRDQYLYPNDGWKTDVDFQQNCLVYTLFHGQNRISCQYGTNHWIPFTEEEVDAQDRFESHFMNDYLRGKIKPEAPQQGELFALGTQTSSSTVNSFESGLHDNADEDGSATRDAVMDAGRELWRYYHRQPGANPNASFYDIRLHFQGTKTLPSGKVQMNTESTDPTYTNLITNLRQRLKELAAAIEPKVYEYGFLKK